MGINCFLQENLSGTNEGQPRATNERRVVQARKAAHNPRIMIICSTIRVKWRAAAFEDQALTRLLRRGHCNVSKVVDSIIKACGNMYVL